RALGGLSVVGLAGHELVDLLGDADGAPVVAAHGAETGVDVQIFIVERPRELGVEPEVEMALPVEGGASFGQLVVAVARAGDSERDVGGVGGDAVGDAA